MKSAAINTGRIRDLTGFLLNHLGLLDHELSIRFVGSRTIRQLNRTYRGKDRSTDVLSFAQKSWKKPVKLTQTRATPRPAVVAPNRCLGDIVISIDDAARNAKQIGQTLDREVTFLIVHGLLHLCGHDHETPTETKRMFHVQKKLMTKLSAANQQHLWKRCVRVPAKLGTN